MESTNQERLAKNEAFFRSVNEHIRAAAGAQGLDGHSYEFLCECADSTCVERVALTVAEYERVRADGTRFVLASGHDIAQIETVVLERADHVVVEKLGAAAGVAEALDPRAA
jgi:hypothetical protein